MNDTEIYNQNSQYIDKISIENNKHLILEHIKFLLKISSNIKPINYLVLNKACQLYKKLAIENIQKKQYYFDVLNIRYNYLMHLTFYYHTENILFNFARYFGHHVKVAKLEIANLYLGEATIRKNLNEKYKVENTKSDMNFNFLELTKKEKNDYLKLSKSNFTKYGSQYLEIYCADIASCNMPDYKKVLEGKNLLKVYNTVTLFFKLIEPYSKDYKYLYSYVLSENKEMAIQYAPSLEEEHIKIEPFYSNRFKNKECADIYLSRAKGITFFNYDIQAAIERSNSLIKNSVIMHKKGFIGLKRLRRQMKTELSFYETNFTKYLTMLYWIRSYADEKLEKNEYLLLTLQIAEVRWRLKQKEKAKKIINSMLPNIRNIVFTKNHNKKMYQENAVDELLDTLEDNASAYMISILKILYLTKYYNDFNTLFLKYNEILHTENDIARDNVSAQRKDSFFEDIDMSVFSSSKIDELTDERFEENIDKAILKMFQNIETVIINKKRIN